MAEQQSGSTDNISLKDRANALFVVAAVGTVGFLIVKGLVIGEPTQPIPEEEYRADARSIAERVIATPREALAQFGRQYASKSAEDLPRSVGGSGLRGVFTSGNEQIVIGQRCLDGTVYDPYGDSHFKVTNLRTRQGYWESEAPNAEVSELPDRTIEVVSNTEPDAPHLNFTVNDKGVLVPSAATAGIIYAEPYNCDPAGIPYVMYDPDDNTRELLGHIS